MRLRPTSEIFLNGLYIQSKAHQQEWGIENESWTYEMRKRKSQSVSRNDIAVVTI